MTVGIAASPTANNMLDLFGNATAAGWATPFLKLHTGDPGAAGTANPSAETLRKAVAFGAASGGSKAATGSPVCQWANWSAGTSIISHVSLWTAASAGTYLGSIVLGSPKTVNNTDTFNITALSWTVTTLAA